ncbi:hypothetical protein MMC11_004731 [Xylographa trunciseda]|nr:hypothetical protein [Xylographa trunciseda]
MATTTSTPHLHDLDIRAVWDGLPAHPVHVALCIRLDLRPHAHAHARFLLLDRPHALVESASIARIRPVTDGHIAVVVGPRLAAVHESQLARLYRDLTSWERFEPRVAAERWRAIKACDGEGEICCVDAGEMGCADAGFAAGGGDGWRERPEVLSVRKRGWRDARGGVPALRRRSRSEGGVGSEGLEVEGLGGTLGTGLGGNVEIDHGGAVSATSSEAVGRTADGRGRSWSGTYKYGLGVCGWMGSGVPGCTGALDNLKASPHTPEYQHTEAVGSVLDSRTDEVSDKTEPAALPPFSGYAISDAQARSFEEVDPTASRSPERWRANRNLEQAGNTSQESTVHHVPPSWVEEDGKQYIVCEGNTTAGTYEIDIKAKIRLSGPDTQHHQSFYIPDLIRAEVAQDRVPTGGFAFYFEPTVETADGLAMRFESKTLLDYHIKESSHIIGRFRLDQTPSISVRTKKPVYCISDFSASVEAYAAFLPSVDSGVKRLQYNARLICEVDEEDVWANQVEFFLVVRHGPSEDGQYHVDNGTCAVLHNTLLLSSGAKESEALISVLRNTEDMHNHLDISFSLPLDVSSPKEVFLPSIRPLFGKVLSESIILDLPRLPLKLEHIQNASQTTWKVFRCSEAGHEMMRFDRLPISSALPQIMEDGPQFRVSELVRVLYRSLTAADESHMEENAGPVARNLHIALFEILGGGLGCQIDVKVQVGKNSEILTIDPQGWSPYVSYVDGRMANEKHGEWRETDDAFLTLFNTRDIKVGKMMHITFFFRLPSSTPILEEDYEAIERDCDDKGVEQFLPRIAGKTILQAVVRSELENCTIILSNPPESRVSRFSRRGDHTEVRLPMLTSDYQVSFINDAPQPTTAANEANLIEAPRTYEEEKPFVVVEAIIKEACEAKHSKVQIEDERQTRLEDSASEYETNDLSFVTIDETSLGKTPMQKPAEDEKSKYPGSGTTSKAVEATPWSRRSKRSRMHYFFHWYIFLPSCFLWHMYSVLGKPMTRAACVFFNDPCPLMTQRLLNGLQVERQLTSPQVQGVRSATPSTLDGHGSDMGASHKKPGEIRSTDTEDRQGRVLSERGDGQVERGEAAGVLDWIDHALGWKG